MRVVRLFLGGMLIPLLCFSVLMSQSWAGNAPPGGEPEEPPFFMPCATDNDSAVIGSVAVELGDEARVPVYVESDDCIENFRFVFFLPTDLDYVAVEQGAWLHGFDPIDYNPVTRELVVEHSMGTGGQPCLVPDIADAFLWLRVTTHCKTKHAISLPITWGVSDPSNPSIFLGHDACNRDPLPVRAGSVAINRITITFDVSEAGGLIGDELTVTVTCDNTYLFNRFIHQIRYNDAVLTPLYPVIEATPRTEGYISANWYGGNYTVVQGNKATGFGTAGADGREMYKLRFKIISLIDDVTGYVRFQAMPFVFALDCNQDLRMLTPQAIYYYEGAVTVPPYRATFDLGETVWTKGSLCDFEVPILLKNNYPLSRFQLAVEYSQNSALPLTAVGLDSEDPLNWPLNWGGNQLCGTVKYTKVETYGESNYPPSADFRQIATIRFRNATVSTDNITYALRLQTYGCPPGDYPTWAESRDPVRTLIRYYLSAPQLDSADGSIVIGDPLAQVSIPSASSACHGKPPICEHVVRTPILVQANADLDTVKFTMTWDPTHVCIYLENLAPNAVVVADGPGTYTIRIIGVPASAGYRSYGTVFVNNAEHYYVGVGINVSGVIATESCAHTRIPTAGYGGTMSLSALGTQWASCKPLPSISKVAVVPDEFGLNQNRPNPFNAGTVIEFTLREPVRARLEVFNIMGQRVRTLIDEEMPSGRHQVTWDGRDGDGQGVATGVYLYRLQAGKFTSTRKMVLLK